MASLGRLIAFEGTEGAGKSTQIARIADMLCDEGYRVEVTAEPGGTALGRELRALLLHRTDAPHALAELFLYLADRAQHVARVIEPALAAGTVVLTDRFSASTIAYQGYGRGLDLDAIVRADALARGGVTADLTVLLDCPVRVGLSRARGHDRFHAEVEVFHERVRHGFHAQAAKDPDRWMVIDATLPEEAVHDQILAAVHACIGTSPRRQ